MLNGILLRDAIISGANAILNCKSSIDELNIFPVPDGDTGTNMSMTISAAKDELQKLTSENICEVAKKAASSMLRGARGNSGVILSILFKGFAQGLDGKTEADGQDLVNALSIGVEGAYQAVMKPTEGTILTVARVACEKGKEALRNTNDPDLIWQTICAGAAEALEDTPRLLPVLKKAGVVDAGGKGLCVIFEGMHAVLNGNPIIELNKTVNASLQEDDSFRSAAAQFDEEIHFTYCTECIIGKENDKTETAVGLRRYLETIGDCVLVVDNDEIIKVHVHTETPGLALQKGLECGQLLTVKVDNMKEQHRKVSQEEEQRIQTRSAQPSFEFEVPEEDYGFVAVAAGEGLQALFKDLGCAQVVSGGQTMNPSTENIVEAVLATPAKVVYVLPNNKNIIMAAQQAIPLVKDRKIVVIPTRSIPQGMSAMLSFEPGMTEELTVAQMMEAAGAVQTGQVTFAARDSEFGGQKIRQNDILGLVNGKLEYIEKDPVQTGFKVAKNMISKSTSFVTLIYGEGVTEEQAVQLKEKLQAKAGNDVEFTLVCGGQPVYYFIISVE